MPASPDVLNYQIGKGTVKWTPDGGAERDLGNAPEVAVTPNFDFLEHFSSRSGSRLKDRTVTREKGGTLRIVLDEITPENLELFLFGGDGGTVETNSAGNKEFDIFDVSEITGVIVIQGTNDVGNQFKATFNNISIQPTGEFGFISDEFNQVELSGEILADDNGVFGTVEETTVAS